MKNFDFSKKQHPGYKGDDPSKIKLSVVIPAYNEGKRIEPTLKDIDSYLEKQPYMYEILVVDNNSKDDTAKIVSNYRETVEHSAIYVLNEPCAGKGCTVQRGIANTRGDYVLFMDADNATRITEIEKMWPKFEEGYDVVIGSRRVEGSELATKQPWIRETLGRMANWLIQVMAVWGITDTQCGFKAFTRESAKDIFSVVTIERWGFDIEVLALARKFGYKIAEVPVKWHHVETELIGGNSYFQTLKDLIQIRWGLTVGKYKKLRENKTERWNKMQADK